METAEKVFAKAASSFQSDLSEEDQHSGLTIETPEALVEALMNHIDAMNSPHRSRLHDAISKVALFAEAFGPYFKIVELLISSHPEFSALAWSGVCLVFQVGYSEAALECSSMG